MIVPTPEAAYDVCKEFMPECSKPIGEIVQGGSSNIKRQLQLLSVTSSGNTDNLVYAQAPNGSYIVRTRNEISTSYNRLNDV